MTTDELIGLLEPTVNRLGYELVDVDLHLGGSNGLVRLYIDQDTGVSLHDCERVSHQVSGLLDVEDPIPGHYVLEVSSPGLNRVLRTPAHFKRFAGQRVRVKLWRLLDGRRRLAGRLIGLERDDIVMEVDGEKLRVPLEQVERVRLAPES